MDILVYTLWVIPPKMVVFHVTVWSFLWLSPCSNCRTAQGQYLSRCGSPLPCHPGKKSLGAWMSQEVTLPETNMAPEN